jgi:hypothetical protein
MYLGLCPRTDPKQMSFTNPKGVKYLIISRRKKKSITIEQVKLSWTMHKNLGRTSHRIFYIC